MELTTQEMVEREVSSRFENLVHGDCDGTLERMQNHITELERAVSHLMGFIAEKLRLTDEEINNENGLTDF